MSIKKRFTVYFLTALMILGLLPQVVKAEDVAVEKLQYEVSQTINDDETGVTISIQFLPIETVVLEKVILPDGVELTDNLTNVTYVTTENGAYDFVVEYMSEDILSEKIVSVDINSFQSLGNKNEEHLDAEYNLSEDNNYNLKANDSLDLNVSFNLKGATYFDGSPMWGTTQKLVEFGDEVPYNGWQLMQVTLNIPFQDGLEILSITPNIDSIYPDYSTVKKDDKLSYWSYTFYFYENKTYQFNIDYAYNGNRQTVQTSYAVEGLVKIKDISMRRHLINTYGDLTNIYYNDGQYVTKEILGTALYDPWGNLSFDFGKDGDNGSTAENTTSLDGLQYLTNIHGMYLFDCSKLAQGETIEPITNTYYPNMKILRISEIFNNRPNLPEGSYTPEMIAQAISNMPNLSELSMCYTGFVDLPVIGQLNGQLHTLEADHCAIESVEGIEKHPNIQMISLAINKIKSIQPFVNADLSHVKFMDLGGNQIFDLRPLNATLNPNIVGAERFGASRQTIHYDKTVIANLKGDQYEIELPMPIDIDGSLTDAVEVVVGFPDGTQKNYTPMKNEDKTYISIHKTDVDSNEVNPFENMIFAFRFNNKNGTDTRTKGAFSGTVYFKSSPKVDNYKVIYSFYSGTRDKSLPLEVTELLPIDSNSYFEGDTITAIQPIESEINVIDGLWKFEGYDVDTKIANEANADQENNISFNGKWIFEPKKYTVSYKFESKDKNIALPEELKVLLPLNETVNHGKTVKAPATLFNDIQVLDGVWSFDRWSPLEFTNVTTNVEFIGVWSFHKNIVDLNFAPVINANNKTLVVGDTYKPLTGVTASDKEDGDITNLIEVIGNNVDTTVHGTYEVTYKVTDSKGASTIKTIFVTVNPKLEILNQVPTINADNKTLVVGDTYNPLTGVTASDKEDGNITNLIEVIGNNVDTTVHGTYEVTYKVTDSKGASTIKTIFVTVKGNVSDNKQPSNSWDDGGPFTTDECGSVYDRWGNLIWSPDKCIYNVNDSYVFVNTSDR